MGVAEVEDAPLSRSCETPEVGIWDQKPQGTWRPRVLPGQGSSCGLKRTGFCLAPILFPLCRSLSETGSFSNGQNQITCPSAEKSLL